MNDPVVNVSITSNADAIKRVTEEAIETAMISIGAQAETYAKALCPVGTQDSTGIPGYIGGTLRGSITFATTTQHSGGESPAQSEHFALRGSPEKGTVVIGTNVEYAIYVEFGARSMKPRPYLAPAISDHLDEYKSMLESALKG